jgi:hypothetical protein
MSLGIGVKDSSSSIAIDQATFDKIQAAGNFESLGGNEELSKYVTFDSKTDPNGDIIVTDDVDPVQ